MGADYLCLTHPFATDPTSKLVRSVRLACIRHAASVHPEPGSNSPFDINSFFIFFFLHLRAIRNYINYSFLLTLFLSVSQRTIRALFSRRFIILSILIELVNIIF